MCAMLSILRLLLGAIVRFFCARRGVLLENLVLREQLAVFKHRHPRPGLTLLDKLFWVAPRRIWSDWKKFLVVVLPEPVVQWHRAGFQLYWRVIPKFHGRVGRGPISKEIRDLIFQMVAENPRWGAPRIHGEHLMLGFDVSERTISRWMPKAPRNPELAKRWLTFLRNHREAIAAMDFFTVPTITFGVLHCFFILDHDRRRILYFHVTRHPTSPWVVQQLRETFPDETAPRFLIFDRDVQYGTKVPAAIHSMKIECVRTSFESPWQNGIAERWVQSRRRDLLDHVIALNEAHLPRLVSDYVGYYHEDRTHLGLEKETPGGRIRSASLGRI
jgi:putative transposase